MDIDNGIAELRSLGLHAECGIPQVYTDHDASAGLTVARSVTLENGLENLNDPCMVFPLGPRWVYRNWNAIGGRGPDCVHYECESLSEAIECVKQYYFGSHLEMDGWLFPVHKHPDWDTARLRMTCAHARTITPAEWRNIRHARYVASKGIEDPDARFMAKSQEIPCRVESEQRMWMRNDLREAFIVAEDSDSD